MRTPDPFDKRAMALSLGVHGTFFVLAWLTSVSSAPEFEFIAYEVELVSPAPPITAEEPEVATEELVVERPEPEPAPPEPEEEEEIVPVEEPEPEPEPDPEPATEVPPEPAEEESPATTPDPPPEEEPDVSGEGINVRLEGLRRDYPAYYNNIIRQIQRCFRWRSGGNWQTTVVFWIEPDGTARDIEFLSRSGSTAFDFEAMGAVDCAGQGRFGPLPEDLPWDRLPIRFDFRPVGGAQGVIPAFGRRAAVMSDS